MRGSAGATIDWLTDAENSARTTLAKIGRTGGEGRRALTLDRPPRPAKRDRRASDRQMRSNARTDGLIARSD